MTSTAVPMVETIENQRKVVSPQLNCTFIGRRRGAFASLVGTIDKLAGRVPLDEFLQPQAWKRH